MSRNSVLSIMFHVVLSVIGFRLSILGASVTEIYLIIMIMTLSYILLGYLFLKPQLNISDDILSVSFVSIILIIMCVVSSLISLQPTQDIVWMIYLLSILQ